MINEVPTGNHSSCSGIIANRLVMIFFLVRYILFERLRRKLVCDEMLQDYEKRRRIELEKIFGVDFGGPGGRGLELV